MFNHLVFLICISRARLAETVTSVYFESNLFIKESIDGSNIDYSTSSIFLYLGATRSRFKCSARTIALIYRKPFRHYRFQRHSHKHPSFRSQLFAAFIRFSIRASVSVPRVTILFFSSERLGGARKINRPSGKAFLT